MKRVITYGTFDIIHPGHINILKKAKGLGDYLIVGLSTDEFVKSKGKTPFYNFKQRKMMLEAIKFVDKIISEKSHTQKLHDIKKYKIDFFVMASDWKQNPKYKKDRDVVDKLCKTKYFPYTQGISSTQIKEYFKKLNNDGKK